MASCAVIFWSWSGVPSGICALDAEAERLHTMRQSRVKRGFVVARIALDTAKFPGFPPLLDVIPCRVKREAVHMHIRVGRAIHRPGREMRKICPDHVAGGSV